MNLIKSKAERLEFLQELLSTVLDVLPQEAERIRKICQFREILISESDRGCALMAAAFIDDSLALLLRSSLVSDRKVLTDLFSHNGPLGTFSGKINLAYSMGLISKNVKRELHVLRRIRNEFAHTAAQIGFTETAISTSCHSLELHGRKADASPRTKFTSSMTGLLIAIEEGLLKSSAIEPPADYDASRRNESISEFRRILASLGRDDFDDVLAEFK